MNNEHSAINGRYNLITPEAREFLPYYKENTETHASAASLFCLGVSASGLRSTGFWGKEVRCTTFGWHMLKSLTINVHSDSGTWY